MAADPLTIALERGIRDPILSELSEADALAEANALLADGDRGEYSAWLLSRAIDIAAQFPENEMLQYYVGKLVEITGDHDAARLCWRGIVERFPNSFNIFPEYFRSIVKMAEPSVALEILESYRQTPIERTDPERAIMAARCLTIIGDVDTALATLDAVEDGGGYSSKIAAEKARLLRTSGRFDEALTLVDACEVAKREPGLAEDIERAARLFRNRDSNGPPSVAALAVLLEMTRERRRLSPRARHRAFPSGIVLIGGTLGGGGAERQLANTALGLTERSQAGDGPIGPISIFCRKLDRRRANDFYLSQLEAAGIRVADYLSAQPWGGDPTAGLSAEIGELVALLPPRMREGVTRLTEILRHEAPDVVQIWQDGMIFAAGLAALLANVPRIILNVRTMPPNKRTDRQKPEQKTLYLGLLAAKGVSLTANSRIAAKAYEEWLGLEENTVLTVANGVEPLAIDAPSDEIERWHVFDANTGSTGFVLGGIMRLDNNKRPLLWLEICNALLQNIPEARFILVGHGPLRAAAEEYARSTGIAERVLFVGRTSHVGFWLSKMDTLGLTSRHEGVPNVLIEAQLAGAPVITTAAGGAPEAVAPNRSNLVLPNADAPDMEAAARHLAMLARRTENGRSEKDETLKNWASNRFSMSHMIDRTLDIFSA